MDEYKLSMIFLDVCSNLFDTNSKGCYNNLNVLDCEKLEESLKDYLNNILGYKLDQDYSLYFREIRKSFENILLNAQYKNFDNINNFIAEYKVNFIKKIQSKPLSEIFINSMKKCYSLDNYGSVVGNLGDSYTIERIPRKGEEGIPPTIIKNIDSFEMNLQIFVENVLKSDSYFNLFFEGMDYSEALSYLFEWVVKNATCKDLEDVEKYIKKYNNFIIDDTLDNYKKPVKIGNLLGDEIYVMRKRANVNYETPYYLSYIIKSDKEFVELPTVRLGIDNDFGIKTAHILATQTSQENIYLKKYTEIEDFIKKLLNKSKYFREFNPAHILSIILSFGTLKGLGINNVEVEEYFPLRFQRLVLEKSKNEDELYNLQYRLTNKNINNYLRLLEFFEGIDIINYPENESCLSIKISDNVISDNPFLQKLYNIGYESGLENKKEEKTK